MGLQACFYFEGRVIKNGVAFKHSPLFFAQAASAETENVPALFDSLKPHAANMKKDLLLRKRQTVMILAGSGTVKAVNAPAAARNRVQLALGQFIACFLCECQKLFRRFCGTDLFFCSSVSLLKMLSSIFMKWPPSKAVYTDIIGCKDYIPDGRILQC